MNIEILIKYWNGISSLFLEMSPFLMLGFLISGLLYIIISKETITNNLGKPGALSVIKAAIFGVPMPLCSCGVIPVAASLYKRGASKGATLSFLISTPQTGVDSILITYGMLGPVFAMTRPVIALITGVIGGLFTEQINSEDYTTSIKTNHKHPKKTLKDAIKYAFISLPQDIAGPLIKGILMAGLITLLIPDNFFQDYGITGWSAMILMAVLSIPMYICATASVPIAAGLISSGIEPGAAFVFLMAGPATNIATISVIINTLGKKIVYIYLSTIFTCSIISGALINKFIIINLNSMHHQMNHNHWLNILSGLLLLAVCIYAISSKFFIKDVIENLKIKADLSFIVKGMTCNHCKETVTEAINTCDGIQDVTINLESGQTFIYGNNLNKQHIITSINNVGYSIGEIA
ncbi:MAG TPA: hypothetical protein EYI88_02130 [Candidatus Marinimicrobia bacterium]|jgi:uncharacterized membrane protein YraQ (UPF0718 family)/copper chaperone CopZ|nr:hypothetical protein [Candidatus Neomarinimicrobiota bacterium]